MQDGGLYQFERSSFSTVEHPTAVMESKGTWHRHGYCNATGKASRKCRPQRSTAIPCTQIRESCNIVFEHSKQCCTVSLVDVEGELCLPKPMMDAPTASVLGPQVFSEAGGDSVAAQLADGGAAANSENDTDLLQEGYQWNKRASLFLYL